MRNFNVVRAAIFLLAVSLTLMFGPITLIGFAIAFDIVLVQLQLHDYKRFVYWYDYELSIMGISGFMGLAGLWLSGFYYHRLTLHLGWLNALVISLLAFGIFGAVYFCISVFGVEVRAGASVERIVIVAPLVVVVLLSSFLIVKFFSPASAE